MKITLQRQPTYQDATLGSLSIDGILQCFTLEDVVREIPGKPVAEWKVQDKTAIPVGQYKVIIDFSNRFQRPMIHVLDVTGFAGIRIHAGNTAADTDGCILVGQSKSGANSTGQSRAALDVLQPLVQAALDRGEDVTLQVIPAVSVLT